VIEISARVRGELFAHSSAVRPKEACGFLAGTGDRIERFYPVRNEDENPTTRYLMDAQERYHAENDIERRGWSVVGIFHSHTHTEAYPSETDQTRAFWEDPMDKIRLPIYPGVRYVIASLKEGEVPLRAFTITPDEVIEEAIRVFDAEGAEFAAQVSPEETAR
jgi:proteasome lid subunit RPN8/RPN11